MNINTSHHIFVRMLAIIDLIAEKVHANRLQIPLLH